MDHLLNFLFKPTKCYRKWYTMDIFNEKCTCVMTCKYPPPSSKMKYAEIPILTKNLVSGEKINCSRRGLNP